MKTVSELCFYVLILTMLFNYTKGFPSMDSVKTTVDTWSDYLHEGLGKLSEIMTRRRKATESFRDARVVKEDGNRLLQEIARDITHMMTEKVNAVKRIKMHAEALSCQRKTPIESVSDYDFFDADNFSYTGENYEHSDYLKQKETYWECDKPNMIPFPRTSCRRMLDAYEDVANIETCSKVPGVEIDDAIGEPGSYRNLTMRYHPQFEENVNLDFSVIRSASCVYVRDKVVLNNIRWSEALDLTFKCNADLDPSLIWQYFASSTGFMRLYPAMKWPDEDYDKTYDHRTRSWYTESMTSPKDMIILLDRSGSMAGKRRVISRQIVHDILDTLADNDYVNVFTFANSTESLVKCFDDTLVQANEENLRLIRESLLSYEAEFYGRLDLAFEKALEILKENHGKRSGVFCTQVIMVIAEGLDYFDQKAFDNLKKLNTEDEHKCRVRIFTYLLETMESDAEVMLKIACDHMGYYANISSVAEIREKVNKYTNVLSRSVNLRKDRYFQPIWSALYVDLADRRLTNWLWHKDEGLQQREIFINFTRYDRKISDAFINSTNIYEKYLVPKKYRYLTTVSLPVYDKREGITTLLGVAAVDVPIDYMNKLTRPYKLGVNGYAFIITNNGYVLMHPDHRTNFKNILKPTFNRVDLTEVELSNATVEPREFDDGILELRYQIVNQKDGNRTLKVMTHMDDMKRIFFTTRHYFYTKIEPYSLVIALQDNYGLNKVRYNFEKNFNPFDVYRERENETWTLHPDWIYFEGMKNISKENVGRSPKQMLRDHLNTCRFERGGCKDDSYYDLLSMFLEDLKSTHWFESSVTKEFKDQVHRNVYGYLYKDTIVTFISTHSGLTRWQYVYGETVQMNFGEVHNKSINEIWYKRSVEENFEYPNNITYIFSIPLKDEMDESSKEFDESQMITVTHAILKEKNFYEDDRRERTPVAVVGYQMGYSGLKDLLETLDCENQISFGMYRYENISCVILDNHGYIIWSNNGSNVGRSILRHNKNITQKLETDGIFMPVKVFDYQGICRPQANVTSCPSSGDKKCRITAHNVTKEYQKRAIKKTVPTPCDKEMRMYKYTYKNFLEREDTLCPYIIQHIPNTNLALLVYETYCDVDHLSEELDTIYPTEKKYDETGDLHLPCFIETYNNYFKRPYIKCITASDSEKTVNKNVQYCGGNQKIVREEL